MEVGSTCRLQFSSTETGQQLDREFLNAQHLHTQFVDIHDMLFMVRDSGPYSWGGGGGGGGGTKQIEVTLQKSRT